MKLKYTEYHSLPIDSYYNYKYSIETFCSIIEEETQKVMKKGAIPGSVKLGYDYEGYWQLKYERVESDKEYSARLKKEKKAKEKEKQKESKKKDKEYNLYLKLKKKFEGSKKI